MLIDKTCYNVSVSYCLMDLPTIQEMWKKDSVIDQVMLDEASLKIPQLHQKYLVLLNEFNLLRKRKRQELEETGAQEVPLLCR